MKPYRRFKKISISGILVIVSAFLLCLLIFIILPLWKSAPETGAELGEAEGKKIGHFTGSFKGTEEGTAESLNHTMSAEEAASVIRQITAEADELEIFSAGINLSEIQNDSSSYKSLYIIKGNAVFTEDMSRVSVSVSESGTISIVLPQPEGRIFIDEIQTEKLAEESGIVFSGSSDDGYKVYTDSEFIRTSGYDSLMSRACAEAKAHAETIASSVCSDRFTYEVSVKNKSGGEVNE